MDTYEQDKANPSGAHPIRPWMFGVLAGALVIALGANAYMIVRANHLTDDLAQVQTGTQEQLSKINASAASLAEENRQRLEAINEKMTSTNTAASAAVRQARAEAQKHNAELTSQLEAQTQKNQELNSELTELKDSTTGKFTEFSSEVGNVKSDVGSVKTDVDGVKAQVASAQSALEQHSAELKRMVGDMGVMSGLIATNSKDLGALRELGERNYYEFTLNKSAQRQRVGDLNLTLKKSDPKRNRFTLEVMADDKRVEKRDRTINEPVQVYLHGNRLPNEIVINEVRKDVVIGYLATPKVTLSQR